MRFHCVTAVASASAGGAADAPKTPSAPRSAPTATVTNKTDRLRAIFPPLPSTRLSWSVSSKSLLGQIAKPGANCLCSSLTPSGLDVGAHVVFRSRHESDSAPLLVAAASARPQASTPAAGAEPDGAGSNSTASATARSPTLAGWDVHHAQALRPCRRQDRKGAVRLRQRLLARRQRLDRSRQALAERLVDFGDLYRQIARPFEWTFTRADLGRLLARIDPHTPDLTLAA